MTKFMFKGEQKQRLDVFLADKYPAVSRSFLQRLCANEQVTVAGKPEKSGYRLSNGDKVEVLYDMASIEEIEDIELPILYQDDDILVINKPVGVISHARGRFWNESSVASFVRQITGQEGERAGIVHRLDRATSGVMVCAKTANAMTYLQKQFADRTVKKTYIAVVDGHMKPDNALIDMPIERNPKAPSIFRVGANGKPAQTEYRVIRSSQHFDEVELLPKTGRTHQLRVHLKHAGHAIVGDLLYDGKRADRLFLHAKSLEIELPSGKTKLFRAPEPPEFKAWLDRDL